MTDCPRESHRLDAKFRGRDPQSQIEIIDRDQNLATKLKHQDGTERTGISYLLTDVICGIARPLSNGQQRIFAHRHRLGINQLSRIGVIEPGMIGITRPPEVVPKRDFEGFQECCFLPDLAMAFSLL
jgi:hypothetical protein